MVFKKYFQNLLEVLKKYQYEFLIFFVLFFELLKFAPPPQSFDSPYYYYLSAYLLSYKLGFVSRSFIGTIANFIYGLFGGGGGKQFISAEFIYFFIIFSLLILIFLVSFLLGKIIKNSTGNLRIFTVFISAVYLASPLSISALFRSSYYIRDSLIGTFFGDVSSIYPLIFILIAVAVLKNKKLNFIIPFICFAMIASHTVSVFFSVAALLIILFYEAYKSGFSKDKLILFYSSLFVSIFSFVYFAFISRSLMSKWHSVETIIATLPKSNMRIDGSSLYHLINAEFFMSIAQHNLIVLEEIYYWLLILLCGIVLLSPLILFFVLFWIKTIKSEKDKILRYVFIAFALSPLLSIPVFFLFVDYGRWIFAIFSYQFLFVLYLLYSKELSVETAGNSIAVFIKNHLFFCFIAVIYLLMLERTTLVFSFPIEINLKAFVLYFLSLF